MFCLASIRHDIVEYDSPCPLGFWNIDLKYTVGYLKFVNECMLSSITISRRYQVFYMIPQISLKYSWVYEIVVNLCMPVSISVWEILTVLYYSPGFATMQLVECIDRVHIQAVEPMVTDMTMIVMEAGRKIEMAMLMEKIENGAIKMMIEIVVMEIVMAEIMRIVMAGMVTEMMTTGEEVKVLTVTNMNQEAGAQIEIAMMMMDKTLLGMYLGFDPFSMS